MVKAAHEPELEEKRLRRTAKRHRARLSVSNKLFEMLAQAAANQALRGKINGIVAEGEETIEDFGEKRRDRYRSGWVAGQAGQNIMRWPATAHSRRGRHNSACLRSQRC